MCSREDPEGRVNPPILPWTLPQSEGNSLSEHLPLVLPSLLSCLSTLFPAHLASHPEENTWVSLQRTLCLRPWCPSGAGRESRGQHGGLYSFLLRRTDGEG